jgi:diguanylate cyclase (GGDEF)-like protein
MPFPSQAPWAFGLLPASPARERGAVVPSRRPLAWAALAGATLATLAVAVGVAWSDRPSLSGALVVAALVVVVSLLAQGLATRILAQLDAAATERGRLEAELAAAHQAQEELRKLAYHDELTGLPIRSLLYDRLGLAIAHAEREGSHLAVLFVDLDGFKAVNDSFGHAFGDCLLVEMALRLRASVRAGDTVARFGGDEFVVLLDSVTDAQDAAIVASKVRGAVEAPFLSDGRAVELAASVGVGVYPRDGASPDELVKRADADMYRDKPRPTPAEESAASHSIQMVRAALV